VDRFYTTQHRIVLDNIACFKPRFFPEPNTWTNSINPLLTMRLPRKVADGLLGKFRGFSEKFLLDSVGYQWRCGRDFSSTSRPSPCQLSPHLIDSILVNRIRWEFKDWILIKIVGIALSLAISTMDNALIMLAINQWTATTWSGKAMWNSDSK
jgi:hypothetical protein